jgi:hypothetical protein
MPYTNGDGTYHDRRTCRRLHNTGGRIRQTDDAGEWEACSHCTAEGERETDSADICTVELSSGGECGREKPCPYHSE